jgi:L-lactate dehydrogenase
MKLGIIGVGAVGAATAMAVVLRARVRELVLIDKDRERARAVATDMHYGVPLSPLVTIKDGDYDDLDGAGLVIIAAGIKREGGWRYRPERSGWPASSSRRQCEGIRDHRAAAG